ncbi:hypothetical protein COCCADRAFT_88667, partial [Bipolaris zeicola 26-R-13]
LRKTLQKLPSTLDKTYERILTSISEEYADYAIRILQWLAFSERPLSLEELAEVIAIDVSRDPEFDRDEVLEDPLDVLRICSSLVSITHESYFLNSSFALFEKPSEEIVVLAHYSVKEYLISDRIKRGQAARYSLHAALCHGAIAAACLGYLNQFQEPELITDRALQEFKLARYSAKFWSRHVRKADDQEVEVNNLACRLLSTENPAYFIWMRINHPDREFRWNHYPGSTTNILPLYCASMLGLEKVVSLFLSGNADPNARGGECDNALQAASTKGHDRIVKILLSAGAKVNAKGGKYGYALLAALKCGHEHTTKVLIEAGATYSHSKGQSIGNLCIRNLDANVEMLRFLHKSGIDLRKKDRGAGRYCTLQL